MKRLITRIFQIFLITSFAMSLFAKGVVCDTVPDQKPIGYFNTSWDDFMTASPSTEIPMIGIPRPNVIGDANVSFPIKLPVGRNDFQPELEIAYSIEGGTTWLGTGWNISLPSITLDTRWGVPQFELQRESEIYLLNGEQLGPVFHRSVSYEREAERTFTKRQERTFDKIIRHGNSPKEYWWEIQKKDGSIDYYGGSPENGKSNTHTISTKDGNITEWLIMESHDVFKNFISYDYQHIEYLGGESRLPLEITYNGYENVKGNYKIHFDLKDRVGTLSRSDFSINCRTGMQYVVADLLDNLTIYYRGNQIRKYVLNYEEGRFSKTLLSSISEFDSENELFYTYNFEYYDELGDNDQYELFATSESWEVAKDNVDVIPVSATSVADFLDTPTILGGAKSWNVGGGVAITVGLVGNLASKENTVGANGGGGTSNGTGVTALVDINGDGLPDKLWKENGAIYYRENLHSQANKIKGFSNQKRKINGISDFSKSQSIVWNVGAELNLGIGVVGGFIGGSHEETNTKVFTFLADFNGDEFIDIASDKKVYFNHLDENGIATFSLSSDDTPSPVFEGEPIDESLVEIDPNEQANLENANPLIDVVRVWKAPLSGVVSISGEIQLVQETDPEITSLPNKDGVKVMIQHNDNELWRTTISAGDYSAKAPSGVASLNVTKGDSLYFRVHSINNGYSDKVHWDPIITYQQHSSDLSTVEKINHFRYQASEDFLVSAKSEAILPRDGEVRLTGHLLKPITSDTVLLSLRGAIVFDTLLPPSLEIDSELVVEGFDVVASTDLQVAISSKSNIDWPAINWQPLLEYTNFDDGSPADDSQGNPLVTICPIVDYQVFDIVEEFGVPFVVNTAGVQTISATISLPVGANSSETILCVKTSQHSDSLVYKRIENSGLHTLQINAEMGDTLYLDLFQKVNAFTALISDAQLTAGGNSVPINAGNYIRYTDQDKSLGQGYRGWGQFGYNANNARGLSPIMSTGLEFDEDELEGDTTLINDGSDPDDVGMTNVSLEELFVIMRADPKSMAWLGPDPHIKLEDEWITSSRDGEKDLSDSGFSSPGGEGISTVILKTKAVTDAIAAGGSVGSVGAGGGNTKGDAWSLVDVTDMNGDRFPDILFENSIQYTNQRGGLSSKSFTHGWGTHFSESNAKGGGIGGSYVNSSSKNSGAAPGLGSNKSTSRVKQKGKSKLSGSKNAHETSKGSIGISANYTKDEDATGHTFLDINGDGLEDKVWNNGDVALNLGYSFDAKRNWGFSTIRSGEASDIGAGVGFNYANGSIMSGFSASRTENFSTTGFTDVNNDALVDLITSVDPLVVRFNSGSGFLDAVTIDDDGEMDKGVSIGESLNQAGTVCIPFVFIKVCVNISGSAGQGTSSINKSFTDINGDGFVDLLYADTDDANLSVRSSKIGKTNQLKKITTPFNGEISIDYSWAGNTSTMPFSKMVMQSITLNDVVEGDGVNIYKKEFRYQNPFYDRHERQFYGFGKVSEYEVDKDGVILRKTIAEYNVNDFYRKGLLKSEALYDSVRLYQKTQYSYQLKSINGGSVLPESYTDKDDGAAFPALGQKSISSFDQDTSVVLSRIYEYEYDSLGNIAILIDSDPSGSQHRVEYDYYDGGNKYLKDKVEAERIFGNGELYRETNYLLDEDGNALEVYERIDADNFANTSQEFDQYGNVKRIVNPENYKGERLEFVLEYDSIEHQYLVKEENGYGLVKQYEYEYYHGHLLKHIDENGNQTNYTIDAKGRPESILYPRDLANGTLYSVQFEYPVSEDVHYAIARHFDESTEKDIITYEFEDGLYRSIQTKVNAMLFDGTNNREAIIVSGTDAYDDLGRFSRSYQPLSEDLSDAESLNTASSSIEPISISYDVLNRPIRIMDAYGNTTNFEYGLEAAKDGMTYLYHREIGPLGLETTKYFTLRGDIVYEKRSAEEVDIWTSYVYDGYGQVRNIIDNQGNETEYSYDGLGRRLTVKVPDAGLTELRYDNAGNLTERITATIRDVINQDGSIRYQYDKERLIQIDYPKYFQNKVQLHYGSPTDSFNRAGRIYLQEDATGGQEFFYDENGNVVKNIRTIMVNRSDIFTYVSEAKFDAHNRILTLVYPDGEALKYNYHIGGKLKSMKGEKAGETYVYLQDVGYNKFQDIEYLKWGNGLIDHISYDNKQRIVRRQTDLVNGTKLMEENYLYDANDIIIERDHSNQKTNDTGANFTEEFTYDSYRRLTSSNGNWGDGGVMRNYVVDILYDDLDNLLLKSQICENDGEIEPFKSRVFDYQYNYDEQPTRPSEIGGRNLKYDKNGNVLLRNSQSFFQYHQNYFDEENRLLGTSKDGYINRYTYDAFGRMVVKSSGGSQGIFVDGAPAGFVEHNDNILVSVNPYFTVTENDFRKHYFMGDLRIATKKGTGLFQSNLGLGNDITAGNLDYKKRIQAYEQSIIEYYADLGVPPGPPTLLALLGQPEINTISLPDAESESNYELPGSNWPSIPPPDTMGPPGIPVFYEEYSLTNENVEAGFNFVNGGITKEYDQQFYHYDAFNNVVFTTDFVGMPNQYQNYLPSGEIWVQELYGDEKSNFLWKGLLFDETSGLYNLGNIYFDPVYNLEQSLDPLLQNFGEQTFLSRYEGELFYDYAQGAENDDDPKFDIQILNAERPDPFTGYSANSISPITVNNADVLDYKAIENAFGGKPPWNATAADVDQKAPFAREISELAPHLSLVDITDPVELKKLVKKVLIKDKIKAVKNKAKSLFGKTSDNSPKPKVKKTGRKVRFK